MPKILLPVLHRRQGKGAEYLAACAAMVLDYLAVPVPFGQLVEVLGLGPYGAPRRNILALARFGVEIEYRETSLDLITEYLEAALPVIVFLHTRELDYWDGRPPSDHAVVVVGQSEAGILLNDPEFETAPQFVTFDEFELAWQETDYSCAVISLP